MSSIDWLSIKNEYINTNSSYRKLADKYKVSTTAIANKAKTENWAKQKQEQLNKTCTKVVQKTADKIVAHEVNRVDKLLNIADKLTMKLEQATDELDSHPIINKTTIKKTAIVEGKPIEMIAENKTLTYKQGIIKVNEVKQLASALRDLKEIQQTTTSNTANNTSNLFTALEENNDDI